MPSGLKPKPGPQGPDLYLALKNLVLRARSELIGYAELYSN